MESPGTGNKSDLFLSVDIDQPVAECLRIGDAALSALVSAEILRFSSPFQSTSGIKASRTKRIIKKREKKKRNLCSRLLFLSKIRTKNLLWESLKNFLWSFLFNCERYWIYKFLEKIEILRGKNRSKRKERLKIRRTVRNFFMIDSNKYK